MTYCPMARSNSVTSETPVKLLISTAILTSSLLCGDGGFCTRIDLEFAKSEGKNERIMGDDPAVFFQCRTNGVMEDVFTRHTRRPRSLHSSRVLPFYYT